MAVGEPWNACRCRLPCGRALACECDGSHRHDRGHADRRERQMSSTHDEPRLREFYDAGRFPRASTFPLTTAPSAMLRRGAAMSPSTDADGCSTTFSVAVTFPIT